MFLQFGDDPVRPTEMGALHSVAGPPGLRVEARSAAEARAADLVLELTATSSPVREERPVISDVDSPAFEATRSWRPTAPARVNADPRPASAPQGAGARQRKKAKRKKAQKAKKAAARQAAKAAQAKPTEWEVHQQEVLAHVHDHFRVAAKSVLQAYAGHRAQEKEGAANTSKRAARRSAACAAGGGDADGEAEPDDDDDAESDDVRKRLEKLEAMEHGEVDWDDDDDVYSLGRGQS
ncbi:MAG: hypothetical protein VXW40_05470, partial [Pseudomonadota bacterium]|nr:hypothetical protein [Pseudomonadota bacterium]